MHFENTTYKVLHEKNGITVFFFFFSELRESAEKTSFRLEIWVSSDKSKLTKNIQGLKRWKCHRLDAPRSGNIAAFLAERTTTAKKMSLRIEFG